MHFGKCKGPMSRVPFIPHLHKHWVWKFSDSRKNKTLSAKLYQMQVLLGNCLSVLPCQAEVFRVWRGNSAEFGNIKNHHLGGRSLEEVPRTVLCSRGVGEFSGTLHICFSLSPESNLQIAFCCTQTIPMVSSASFMLSPGAKYHVNIVERSFQYLITSADD